ncbi:hypothetical protein DFJ74DRAFT_738319 [Hyaloraphidium curvatum]|nr:hypothetical protein DFJ74DRAFT_738319 [Hyaloraphidium curvatum]
MLRADADFYGLPEDFLPEVPERRVPSIPGVRIVDFREAKEIVGALFWSWKPLIEEGSTEWTLQLMEKFLIAAENTYQLGYNLHFHDASDSEEEEESCGFKPPAVLQSVSKFAEREGFLRQDPGEDAFWIHLRKFLLDAKKGGCERVVFRHRAFIQGNEVQGRMLYALRNGLADPDLHIVPSSYHEIGERGNYSHVVVVKDPFLHVDVLANASSPSSGKTALVIVDYLDEATATTPRGVFPLWGRNEAWLRGFAS